MPKPNCSIRRATRGISVVKHSDTLIWFLDISLEFEKFIVIAVMYPVLDIFEQRQVILAAAAAWKEKGEIWTGPKDLYVSKKLWISA